MKCESVILKNEQEFREYLFKKFELVKELYIFEDKLEHKIYFYCFLNNNYVIATKEDIPNDFDYYVNIYSLLPLKIFRKDFHEKVLKLKRF